MQFTLAPIAIIVGMLAGLIVFEPDLGTAVAMSDDCGVLLFVAGLDLRWFAMSALLVGAGVLLPGLSRRITAGIASSHSCIRMQIRWARVTTSISP